MAPRLPHGRPPHRVGKSLPTLLTLPTLLVLLTLLTGTTPAVAATPHEGSRTDRQRLARVDAHIRERMAATGTPGAALAVVERGRVTHTRGYGRDGDGRPVTPGTPFLWGSVAKPFTALTVTQLAEAGRLDLDDPVRAHLPWFRLADPDASARITVRHLLTHTSGLPRSASDLVSDRYDNRPDGLRRAVRDLADVRPAAPPGRAYSYSSAGYAVLGALVEELTGRPFATQLRREVLDPLRMRHAVATERDFRRQRVSPGHRQLLGHPVRFDAPFDGSGTPYGYLGGTVGDLARFARAQLNGGALDGQRVLSARGVAETHRGQVASSGDHYGLGWSVTTLEGTGQRAVWHSGALPGYQAMVVLLPDSDRAVILLQNAFSVLRDRQFTDAAFGAAQILSGTHPTTTGADPLFTGLPWATCALVPLLLLALLAPALRRPTARTPRTPRRTAVTGGLAVTGALGLTALLGWGLPAMVDSDLSTIALWAPDLGWSVRAALVLAPLLALQRLWLTARRLHRARRSSPGGPVDA